MKLHYDNLDSPLQETYTDEIKSFLKVLPIMTKCVVDLLDSLGVQPESILFDNFGA